MLVDPCLDDNHPSSGSSQCLGESLIVQRQEEKAFLILLIWRSTPVTCHARARNRLYALCPHRRSSAGAELVLCVCACASVWLHELIGEASPTSWH